MRNVYVVTYFLLYIIEVLAAFVIFIILRHIVGDHTSLIIFGVLCVVAIPLAFVLLKRLLNSEKGKPSAMLHEAFRNEVMTNGFTQKALDMANQAMREHTSGKEMSIVYLKDTVKTQPVKKAAAAAVSVNPQKASARVNPQKASARTK